MVFINADQINPEIVGENANFISKVRTILILTQNFFHTIKRSTDSMPINFRFFLSQIFREVSLLYPDQALPVIGNFLFLRYFCPAIVSPETHEFVRDTPTPEARRVLILVSKVLQNLVNGYVLDSLCNLTWAQHEIQRALHGRVQRIP